MKTILLSLLLFCTGAVNAQTNVYHPFPDSNAVWNFHFLAFSLPPAEGDYSIIISGDTVINSVICHKLTRPFVHYYPGRSVSPSVYKGAIRQDIPSRRVYYVPPGETSEQLLYDFNMQVGDTVRSYIEHVNPQPDVVLSIDSVLVGNSYCKRWLINQGYNIYFIEGIGSTYGLVEMSPGQTVDAPDFSLICFKKDDQPMYPDTLTVCDLITGIDAPEVISSVIKVFPNPSNGSFSVDPANTEIADIMVRDISGTCILKKQGNNRDIFMINDLPAGIYMLTITERNGNTTNRKIVITR